MTRPNLRDPDKEVRLDNANEHPGCTTRFYETHIPAFAESALETLYGALYSSLPQLSLGELRGTGTYTAADGGQLHALFLYRRQGREVRVINEGMNVDATDAERFARELFARDLRADRIRFHAVRISGELQTQHAWQAPVTEDIVLALPGDEASYMALLGKSTRKTLRQNLARAGELQHDIVPGDEADESLIDTIIGFNHARMAGKQRSSAIDARACEQLAALVRARGMVGTVCMDGALCAGTLACRFGDDVYSLVNAHDPAADHFGMGNISRHLMILAAIRAHAQRFHLLGGHFSSKRTCGALRVPLDELMIYRSRRAMLAGVGGLVALALRSADYRLRVAIEDLDAPRPSGSDARIADRALRLIRDAVQALRRLKTAQH